MARPKPKFLKQWHITAALTALWVVFASMSRADTFQVSDIAGGINDAAPANLIGDNEASSISNFHVNPISHGLDQRRGSTKQNSTKLSGNAAVDIFSHVKSDGTAYLISVASKTVSYSTSNGATWTTLVTTMTNGAVWDFASFVDDSAYGTNQSDGGWSFNGTAFAPAGSMPAAKFLEPYQNRLFAANTSGFPYRVFFSGLLQASTWTTSTDWFDMPESVVGVGQAFDGGLPIYTANSVWMLRGSSPNDFYLQQVSGNIGAADNRDIKNFEVGGTEYQVFLSLGPNRSRTTIYGLLGNRLVDLGEKVPNLLSGVAIFDSSSRSKLWDVPNDFSLGTSSQTYVSSTEEAVKLSTFTQVDTSSTDFTAGTTSNTSVIGGSVYLSTNETNVTNNGFETCTPGSDPPGWTSAGSNHIATCDTSSKRSGTYGGFLSVVGGSLSFYILDVSGNILLSTTTGTSGSFVQISSNLSAFVGKYIKARFSVVNGGNVAQLTSVDPFLCSGGTFSFYYDFDAGAATFNIDDLSGGRSTTYSGTFTSQAFNTNFSSAVWLASGANWTTNGDSVSAQTQSSTDGSSWQTAVAWSTGTAPASDARKYIRYVLTLSTGGTTSGTALPHVDDVTMSARATTGTYTSDVLDGGSSLSSWGVLSANTSSTGQHTYQYRNAVSTTALAAAAYTNISSGGSIAGTGRYFQWNDTLVSTSSEQDPTLNSLSVNYSQASGAAQPGDMEVWNQDLWMTYTSTSSTYNSSIILMNSEGKFSTLAGLTVYGFATHNRQLLAGTSLNDGVSGGYVRRLDVGTTDDGTAITSYVVFKAQGFPGDYQDWVKNMSGGFFNYGVSVGTFTATIRENFSDATQSKTVDSSIGNTVGRYQLQADPGTSAKQMTFSFSNSYPGFRLQLFPPLSYYFSKQKIIPAQ